MLPKSFGGHFRNPGLILQSLHVLGRWFHGLIGEILHFKKPSSALAPCKEAADALCGLVIIINRVISR